MIHLICGRKQQFQFCSWFGLSPVQLDSDASLVRLVNRKKTTRRERERYDDHDDGCYPSSHSYTIITAMLMYISVEGWNSTSPTPLLSAFATAPLLLAQLAAARPQQPEGPTFFMSSGKYGQWVQLDMQLWLEDESLAQIRRQWWQASTKGPVVRVRELHKRYNAGGWIVSRTPTGVLKGCTTVVKDLQPSKSGPRLCLNKVCRAMSQITSIISLVGRFFSIKLFRPFLTETVVIHLILLTRS